MEAIEEKPGSLSEKVTSYPNWDKQTNGSEVAERFSGRLEGKNVVITGVSPQSLGETLATTIAQHNPANLILASRSKAKLEDVKAQINKKSSTKVNIVVLDLSSQASIRQAAQEISQLVDTVDILINNAAVVTSSRQTTTEGIEAQFGVNHIGHFLLVSLLLPKLLASSGARIVNVTSLGHRVSPVRFSDWNFEGKPVPAEEQMPAGLPESWYPSPTRPYFAFCAYGQSKTANILHALSLNEKFGDRGLRAFAVHPGSIDTDLSRNLNEDDYTVIRESKFFKKTHDQGIATILVAAFDPALERVADRVYLSDCQLEQPADWASKPEFAERLWKLSESLIGGALN